MDNPVHVAKDLGQRPREAPRAVKAKAGETETDADDTTTYPQAAEAETRNQQSAGA